MQILRFFQIGCVLAPMVAAYAHANDLNTSAASIASALARLGTHRPAGDDCEIDLGRTEAAIAAAFDVPTPVFTKKTAVEKLRDLSLMADYWQSLGAVDSNELSASQIRRAIQFNDRLRKFKEVSHLSGFAREALIIAAKLEPLVSLSARLPKNSMANLKVFLRTTVAINAPTSNEVRALRSILYAEMSRLDLDALEPREAFVWAPRLNVLSRFESVEFDLKFSQAITSAIWHLDQSIEEDQMGLQQHRYLPYAAELLELVTAELARDVDPKLKHLEDNFAKLTQIIEVGLNAKSGEDTPERRAYRNRVVQILLMIRRNLKERSAAHLSDRLAEVMGLVNH